MGNNQQNRQWAPGVKPVERIELSEKNVKLRVVLLVVFVIIALVALATGLSALLSSDPGWQKVEVNSSSWHCGDDFVLHYEFGGGALSATAENKKLTAVYTAAAEQAWQLFLSDTPEKGNLAQLNAHVNEPVAVDPALYDALALAVRYESRHIFLATVYDAYSQVFSFEDPKEAAEYDPGQNQEELDYVRAAAAFANDPAAISLELLENGQVKLHVSDDYLTFAKEQEISRFVDFGWMGNAFIADFLAEKLTENGFTNGYLASYDGFTRNLDTRSESYSVNFFDRQGDQLYIPARMEYTGAISMVFFRDFPLSDQDRWHYYSFPNGRTSTTMVDPADGVDKAAVPSLMGYSRNLGCAELTLQLAPLYVADTLAEDALQALTGQEIYAIWTQGTELRYNEATVSLTLLPDTGIAYTKALIE